MSSFKKREKALRRTHKERAQPSSRQHLGLLEKHKDYSLRAKDFHKKQAQLKLLHEKARNRNPDEFYFKMVNRRLQGGRHVVSQEDQNVEEKETAEEKMILQTKDIKYIQMKLNTEKKKIQQLQAAGIHSFSAKHNKHKIFVDTPEEVINFDPKERFMQPESNPLNADSSAHGVSSDQLIKPLTLSRKKSRLRMMKDRMRRCHELQRIEQKMQTQKHLSTCKERFVKIRGDGPHPRTYRWFKERKK